MPRALSKNIMATTKLNMRAVKAVITEMIAKGDAVEDVIRGTLWHTYRVESDRADKAFDDLLNGGAIRGNGVRNWDDNTCCAIYAIGAGTR